MSKYVEATTEQITKALSAALISDFGEIQVVGTSTLKEEGKFYVEFDFVDGPLRGRVFSADLQVTRWNEGDA